jgi:hypothetical protein
MAFCDLAKAVSSINGMKLTIEWLNGSTGAGSVESPRASTSVATLAVTGKAPSNATHARLHISDETNGTGTWDAYLDGAMLVEGGVPSRYYGPTDPYPTSTRYGGPNRSVDEPGEIDAVRSPGVRQLVGERGPRLGSAPWLARVGAWGV